MYSKLKNELNDSITDALNKLRINYDDEIIIEETTNPSMGDTSRKTAF